MLSLTKKTDYALIALSYLAKRSDQTVSAREIAAEFEMPAALVMNILKTLHHNGVLSSTRGTKGGYRLCTDLGKISVHGLVQILEGPVQLTECSATDRDPREPRRCKVRNCPISGPIQTLHAKLVKSLKEVKLADLMRNGRHVADANGETKPDDGAAAVGVPEGGEQLICGGESSDSRGF